MLRKISSTGVQRGVGMARPHREVFKIVWILIANGRTIVRIMAPE